jgi:hypothetical protein
MSIYTELHLCEDRVGIYYFGERCCYAFRGKSTRIVGYRIESRVREHAQDVALARPFSEQVRCTHQNTSN